MAKPSTPRVSACECGGLTLTVTGDPAHVHACTCTKCQRTSGSGFSWSAWFDADQVQISGAYSRYYYTGAQDEALMAGFCPICGGGKFFTSGDYLPGHIGIAVGNFADPAYLVPDHIHWWPNRPVWLDKVAGPTPLDGN